MDFQETESQFRRIADRENGRKCAIKARCCFAKLRTLRAFHLMDFHPALVATSISDGIRFSLLFTLCFLIAAVTGFVGDHVCQQDERYTINVTEYYPLNITIRQYQWCMQVPPRCSVFSYRTINASRIMEEERTRPVSVCCDGYEPDSIGEKCVPSCETRCQNGVCNEENKCYCQPGFRGDYCEKACDANRWGRYCRYQCDCERGSCNPITGQCHCPSGWTGIKCNRQCPEGYFGDNCHKKCDCNIEQTCDPQDGRCIVKLKLAVLKKYHTFDTIDKPETGQKQTQIAKKVDMYLLTTEPSNAGMQHTNANKNRNSLLLLPSVTIAPVATSTNSEYETTLIAIASTTIATTKRKLDNAGIINNADKVSTSNYDLNEKSASVVLANGVQSDADKTKTNLNRNGNGGVAQRADGSGSESHAEVNIKSMDRKVMKSEIPPKGKAASAEVDSNDTSAINSSSKERPQPASLEHDEMYNLATIALFCIVAVAVSGFLIGSQLVKRLRRKAEKPQSGGNLPTSIFHMPLPDPPQSPFFESPLCAHYHKRIGDNDVSFKQRTSVLSSISPALAEDINDAKELSNVFYDQLPPTHGTYKAAMVPEPPPTPPLPPPPPISSIDDSSEIEYAFNQNGTNSCPIESYENVYDEIPCWKQSPDNDALYINTRIENKTQF